MNIQALKEAIALHQQATEGFSQIVEETDLQAIRLYTRMLNLQIALADFQAKHEKRANK